MIQLTPAGPGSALSEVQGIPVEFTMHSRAKRKMLSFRQAARGEAARYASLKKGVAMDIGVIIALSALGLSTLLVVLLGVVAGVSAVVGIGSPHESE